MRPVKIILSMCIVSISLHVAAQQKGPSFIGITGGLSMPIGNWGKSDFISSTSSYVSDPAGFAAKGPVSGLEGAYFFSKHIGVGAALSYATYKTKDLATLSAGYQESFDVDQVTTTANSYKSWSFMPGLYFDFPLAGKLSFTARAMAGITHVSTPTISVKVEDGGVDDGTFEQKSASKTAFGIDAGIGLSYQVVKCVAINLHGDYFYSRPDFTIENTQRNNAAGRYITSYNEPLAGINVSLGIAFLLSKK